MFFVIFESEIPQEKLNISTKYYKSLLQYLHHQQGLISETQLASPKNAERSLTFAVWVDDITVAQWRNEPNHVIVQQKSRQGVFRDYRLRVGEVISDSDAEFAPATTKPGQVMVVYQYPNSEGAKLPEILADLIDGDLPSALSQSLVDWSVYQGSDIIVLSAWSSATAAIGFEKLIRRIASDNLHRVRIDRDYGMFDRQEAPDRHGELAETETTTKS